MNAAFLTPATRLEDVYKTLSPEPLRTPDELRAFYRDQVNQVRGDDRVARLKLALDRASGAAFYKAFLMGHPGVGKSTELSRLAAQIGSRYQVIRFSATSELDPAGFKPFDVLLLMMAEVAERTAAPAHKGGTGNPPPDDRLKEVWDWFASEKSTQKLASEKGIELAAGAGVTGDSWWAKALGLFANIRGEMKYTSAREKERVDYRLNRLSTLIDLANRLLDDCNRLLRTSTLKEWLFIGEDFDKPGIPPVQIEGLFLTYANIFKELRTHLIFTIPVDLGYSSKSVHLPVATDRIISIPDMPVFNADHSSHNAGRNALRSVLEARVVGTLFEEGQMSRLIVASGGNLRDLFSLVSQSADNALLQPSPVGIIRRADADAAIRTLRTEYERRLGQSPYDRDRVSYEDKVERLLLIYNQDPAAKIPADVLHSLLRARAVQEFDGERWFGVHPLVVDILAKQRRIQGAANGSVPGGSE